MKNPISSLLRIIGVFLFSSVLTAQTSLPKEVQADLKQEEIISALKQKDFDRADSLFAGYDEIGVDMPPPLVLMRAQVSFQLKRYLSAKHYIEQYLAKSERGSEEYKKALKMYSELQFKQEVREKNIYIEKQLSNQFCKDFITAESLVADKKNRDWKNRIGDHYGTHYYVIGEFMESQDCTVLGPNKPNPSVSCKYDKRKFPLLIEKIQICVSAAHGEEIVFTKTRGYESSDINEWSCREKIEANALDYGLVDSMRDDDEISVIIKHAGSVCD